VTNARHKLLDVVDFVGPALLVGVRQLNCILLGSTWPHLLQWASVPVMVVRRRLWRARRAQSHLAPIPAYLALGVPNLPLHAYFIVLPPAPILLAAPVPLAVTMSWLAGPILAVSMPWLIAPVFSVTVSWTSRSSHPPHPVHPAGMHIRVLYVLARSNSVRANDMLHRLFLTFVPLFPCAYVPTGVADSARTTRPYPSTQVARSSLHISSGRARRLRRSMSSPRRSLRPPLEPSSASASVCALSNLSTQSVALCAMS
jgi:hypothetical protein